LNVTEAVKLNKSDAKGMIIIMPSLYTRAEAKDIGEYVLFSGDPWRVETVCKYLDEPQKIAFSREFNTYTGFYKGLRITATSTGIGAPSAAIAMEEMYECGMRTALRMGTSMALDDDMLGHYIVPIASMRRDGTSFSYADASYPAVAELEFVNVINETVAGFGKRYVNGVSCTMDGFYTQMRESKFSKERGVDMRPLFSELRTMKVSGVDMESACMLTVGRLMGVSTAVLTVATVLENLKQVLEGDKRIEAEDLLCRIALESLYKFSKRNK